MQLFYSQTSPFARKVNMLLHFTGLIHNCELVQTTINSAELRAKNPLGKIPALAHNELVLFESDLICEYIDDLWALEGNLSLIQRGSRYYYQQQKAAAQANGVLEAAVQSMFESKRETEPSTYWLERWHEAIKQGLTHIEIDHCGSAEKPIMSTFCLAATLGYLDFRHPDIAWRDWREDLKNWLEPISSAPWFTETAPPSA